MIDLRSINTIKRKFIFTKVETPSDLETFVERKPVPQLSLQRMAALIEAKKELDLKLRSIPGGNFELIGKLYDVFDEVIMDEFETAKQHDLSYNKIEGKRWVGCHTQY